MKRLCLYFAIVFSPLAVHSQEKKQAVVPEVEALLSPFLSEVVKPIEMEKMASLALLISTPDAEAGKLTWAGYSFLHAGWDVEAYRHFSQALRRDENCLMAHVGVALALASPHYNEHITQRQSAVIRILELVEARQDGIYYFPEKERGFALAICYLFTEGRAAGVQVFDQLAKKYPKDIQIPLMAATLKREGYDALGKARFGEELALEEVWEIYNENPEHPLAAQYLLVMHLDAPVPVEKLEKEILPIARKLGTHLDVATWSHWLGVFEYRCGNLKRASSAFKQSIDLLERWKKENAIEVADADALWKSYLYQAMVEFEMGNTENALAIGDMFKALKVDKKRLWAPGSQLILWEGYSLKTRMYVSGGIANVSQALQQLPNKKVLEEFKGDSAALNYYEYLYVYLEMLKAAAEQNQPMIDQLYSRLVKVEQFLREVEQTALKSGESQSCIRFYNHARQLGILSGHLGQKNLAYQSLGLEQAVSMGKLPKRMLPPLFFTPLEITLSEVLVKRNEAERAQVVIEKALDMRPSSRLMWKELARVARLRKDEKALSRAEAALR